MASISVVVAGWEAEVDVPTDENLLDYQRRKRMLVACERISHSGEAGLDEDKQAAMEALVAAVKAAYPELPIASLTEE